MTTQSNPSPFSTDIKTDNIPSDLPTQQSAQSDFEMRTLKEDLAKIQASGIIMEKTPAPANAPAPKQAAPIQPQLQSQLEPQPEPLNPAEVAAAEKISPFPPQVPSNTAAAPADSIMQEVPVSVAKKSKKPASIKIVAVIIALLVISIIALGVYYFAIVKKSNRISEADLNAQPLVEENKVTEQTEAGETIEDTTEEEAEPEQINPIQKYSAENPNYLVIDPNVDQASVKSIFQKVSDELKGIQTTSLYEFIVVDSNNNPIPFLTFAAAAKLNFSQTVLSSFGNSYSIYFFNDNANIRLGLVIESTNKEKLIQEIAAEEKTLERDISFLFLNDMVEVKNSPFASSTYGIYPIRFANIDATKNLSIDYSVTDTKFIISTSKNTERAVIDKVFQNPKQTVQSNSVPTIKEEQNISNQTENINNELGATDPTAATISQ